MNKELVSSLTGLAAEMASLNPDDQPALVLLGAALEDSLQGVPADRPETLDLLNLCLEALQAIYLKAVPDLARLANSAARAVFCASQCLGFEQESEGKPLIYEAGRALWLAAGKNPRACPFLTDSLPSWSAELSQITLDDAASLLMQIEATLLAGLDRLKDAVQHLSQQDSYSPNVRHVLGNTAREIAAVADNITAGADGPLVNVGKMLETALECVESDEEPPLLLPTIAFEEATAEQPEETADESDLLPMDEDPQEPEAEEALEEEVAPPPLQAEAPLPAAAGPAPSVSAGVPKPAPVVGTGLPEDADPDLLREFTTESGDYIEAAEAALLSLETDPEDLEAISTVFRAFHTIKGIAGFLGLAAIQELAHHAETLLTRVRDHEIRCTGGYADLALRSVDMLKELVNVVNAALNGSPQVKPEGYDGLLQLLVNPEAAGISAEAAELGAPPPRVGDILVAEGKVDRSTIERVHNRQPNEPIGVSLVREGSATLTDVAKALRTQKQLAAASGSTSDSSVRVRTDRLDGLIDAVGELVIAQSMVSQDQIVTLGAHHDLARKVSHQGKIVRELQDLSMSMRMVPLKATFQKMNRLARDVAQKTGKLVEFITSGEDTEIDRNMVDVVSDPLVHMVRNAVDHGIETPDVREQAGKSRTGCIHLSAYHAGGSVIVELRDDGRGLNREKILQKALSQGLIDSDKGMSDSEVFGLIFRAGFSTAEVVTDVSGRGVGMDVVRQSIAALRGRVDIASEQGLGSTFTVRLPLTLAITDGMLIRVGDQRFIVPTAKIQICFRPEADALSTIAGKGEMALLRDEILPMFRLHRLFDIDNAVENPTEGLLVVVGDSDRRYALLVDELLDQQQVVAKSLSERLGQLQGVSGGAILADGRVGLILDPDGLLAAARQKGDASSPSRPLPIAA
ncbi:MAG TPA: chemotaxis protein CheA [Armatimonadota bacterium]|jgi:two-component system chemotaxis sensor kinase CheA